jgi:hypothetical protein
MRDLTLFNFSNYTCLGFDEITLDLDGFSSGFFER